MPPLNSAVRRQSWQEVHIVKSSKIVVVILVLAATLGTLAVGLLAAKNFLSWVMALPSNATSLFTIISLLVAAVLVGVALRLNSKRRKVS